MEAQSIKPYGTCNRCGAPLTREEAHYYEFLCEDCERAWHERLQNWLNGDQDEYLDNLFGAKEQTIQ